MYRGVNVTYPIPVKVTVSVKPDATKSSTPLATTTVQLRKPNQELTVLRFRLDSAGQLVPAASTASSNPPRGGLPMMIAPVIFALLLGAFIFAILPHAGIARRTLSVGIFLALITVVYVGASELLGRPKPLALEWRDTATAQVVGAVPIENEAIYVWLTTAGSPELRAYVLPWSQQAAQQLQDAMGKAEADGHWDRDEDAGRRRRSRYTRVDATHGRNRPCRQTTTKAAFRPLAIHSRARSRVFRFVLHSCSLEDGAVAHLCPPNSAATVPSRAP
ncbi:hypothetical protein C7I87_06225 [Mesorhizobium sp. SARCC-RB16n]|uniref:hypothetical protein n=1 Tax=Mesorhizobium sp. SARCC-RB16n TaxID=2116687 RepID=UPI00122EE5E1|nr:hypothetical protein [Mesorhizobium sp. SARCC-RB16n]KAA3451606.1 hypothetical protein C7I87_06225 [Mesorhizobium sp. SARCC-RB16n]